MSFYEGFFMIGKELKMHVTYFWTTIVIEGVGYDGLIMENSITFFPFWNVPHKRQDKWWKCECDGASAARTKHNSDGSVFSRLEMRNMNTTLQHWRSSSPAFCCRWDNTDHLRIVTIQVQVQSSSQKSY